MGWSSRGRRFRDGRTADGVYIVLNEIFREVLNNAPIRPLNYEYLKVLAPAPQRFYEIVSARIYAAQKNKNPYARILYSEFCTYSALTRHFDYENFRVQMAKIHKDHLKSGYIAKVHYEETRDSDGRIDGMMCYQRGEADGVYPEEQGSIMPVVSLPPRKPALPKDPLLEELTSRGITESKAKKILAGLQEGQHVMDQLERYLEFQRREVRRALDQMDTAERGKRTKAARAYLLTEHPQKGEHQQLIAEGDHEAFHRLSEEYLLEATLAGLDLPNFEDWKRYALSAIAGK